MPSEPPLLARKALIPACTKNDKLTHQMTVFLLYRAPRIAGKHDGERRRLDDDFQGR